MHHIFHVTFSCQRITFVMSTHHILCLRIILSLFLNRQENSKLRQLYLAGNGFGVTGSLHMIRALVDNRCLERLDLSDNRIPFCVMACFAKCFKVNRTLRQLRLCSNPVTPEGAMRFVKLLAEFDRCGLELLDIRVRQRQTIASVTIAKVHTIRNAYLKTGLRQKYN